MRLAIPTAKSRYTSVGGSVGPLAKAITKPMISLKNPKTNIKFTSEEMETILGKAAEKVFDFNN